MADPVVTQSDFPLALAPRFTTLTPQVIGSLKTFVLKGLSFRQAAIASGVTIASYDHWMQKAKDGLEPYRTLFEELGKCHAEWQASLVGNLNAAGRDPKHWQANSWLLSHQPQSRAEWGDKTGQDGPAVIVQVGVQGADTSVVIDSQALEDDGPIGELPAALASDEPTE